MGLRLRFVSAPPVCVCRILPTLLFFSTIFLIELGYSSEHGAYAHRCGGPLSSRPLSPLPCNAAVPKGPTFFV